MRVLITGATGFIGTNLCHRLSREDGVHTLGLDIRSRGHSDCSTFVVRDIRDRQALALDFDFFRPQVVVHLAATLGVENVMLHPGETITNNVLGTMNVLELADNYGAHVLFASTSDVYGHSKDLPFKESGYSVIGPAHEPRWSYAISKLAGEHLCQAIRGTILRFFNVTGPGQSTHYVLPYFVEQALKGGPITVYGEGKQTRCFTDVRDITKALVKLIDLTNHSDTLGQIEGETYNIGGDHEITMLELACLVKELVNPKAKIKKQAAPSMYTEMPKRKPDTSKLQELIDWSPQITLTRMIKDVASYQSNAL